LPHPDEIVHLDDRGLVLEEAGHHEFVPVADRDRAIEATQLAAEVSEREHEPRHVADVAGDRFDRQAASSAS